MPAALYKQYQTISDIGGGKKMDRKNVFFGEFLGTALMLLFGCGTVAVSVLFGALVGQFQIAIVWGTVITLSIYMTRHICNAHFNPAVSIAMAATGRMKASELPVYLAAQFLGAFSGALLVYLLFGDSIRVYEEENGIVRGTWDSVATAKIFGEYYAQPGSSASVSIGIACAAELIGTFVLVYAIFSLTENANVGRPDSSVAPIYIGLTVTVVQCLIAPLTQAGLNPARDFAPRFVALIFGWGAWSFPDSVGGAFWVYILSPIVGGLLAGLLFTKVAEPGMKRAGV